MSLGNSNISLSAIKTETGLSGNKGSELVGAAGLNKYSFYAPGSLSVDGNKDVVITPPSANLKAGDFRSYNNASLTPSAQANYTQNWGPGGSTVNFTQSWFPQAKNIKEFADPGDYVTAKYYLSADDRTNEAGVIHSQIFAITFNGITPLAGHTRQTTYRANSTQTFNVTGFPTGGLSTPDCLVYCETYISDISGNRKINLGARANNYTTITFHQSQEPYVHGVGNIPSPPSGYTAIFPELNTAGTPVCNTVSPLTQSLGTAFSFYVKARGIYGSDQRIVAITNVDVVLTLDGVSQTIYSGALSEAAAQLCSGTLASGGTWNYDKIGVVTFENVTIAPVPAYTTC
jgi:hypothetical protein